MQTTTQTSSQMTDDNADTNTATQTVGYNADDGQRCRQQQCSRRRQCRDADDKMTQ
jgi:hypothetical protein